MLVVLAVVLLAAGVTAIVLTAGGGGRSTALTGSGPATTTAAAPSAPLPPVPGESRPPTPGGGDSGSGRPLPPPTPTGEAYDNDDPPVGGCVDIAPEQDGVTIFHADCGDPAASLILDNVQTEKCLASGFYGLRSLSNKVLCFTYNIQVGDCVDLDIPRRAACTDTTGPSGPKPLVKVTEMHPGQQDGTTCANPKLFLQVGKDTSRGIACLAPATHPTATTAITR